MPRPDWRQLLPVLVLGAGCALLLLAKRQEALPLAAPLEATVPASLLGRSSQDHPISEEEQRVAGMSNYLFRTFGTDSTGYDFSLYVGYYEDQAQGRSIHSPKNCLPGAGWEPIHVSTRTVEAGGQSYQVNRYLLGNQNARAVVYYWYQGRGRVAWNEYGVKWELLRDKAVHGRSEEALVRIVVPVRGTEEEADAMALAAARELIAPIFRALPRGPSSA